MPTPPISQAGMPKSETQLDSGHEHGWGIRLSDKIRAALGGGDVVSAAQLALHGDGQTRDLAREHAFMVRGLGFTLQVLLPLLVSTVSRGRTNIPVSAGSTADADLTSLLMRLVDCLRDDQADAAPASVLEISLAALADVCIDALRERQERFAADQTRRAGEVVHALTQERTQSALVLLEAKEQAYVALHDPLVRFMADSFA